VGRSVAVGASAATTEVRLREAAVARPWVRRCRVAERSCSATVPPTSAADDASTAADLITTAPAPTVAPAPPPLDRAVDRQATAPE
jgi:hypothetical protein